MITSASIFHYPEARIHTLSSLSGLVESTSAMQEATGDRSISWTGPVNEEHLVVDCQGALILNACTRKKVLPASVLNSEAKKAINEQQALQGRVLSRDEKSKIKTSIRNTMLMQAFTAQEDTLVIIDQHQEQIIIASQQTSQVQRIIALLKQTFGHLNISIPKISTTPAQVMTTWLSQGHISSQIALGKHAQLTHKDHQHIKITLTNMELSGQDVLSHIHRGHQVTACQLIAQDQGSFKWDHRFLISQIKYTHQQPMDKPSDQADQALLTFQGNMIMALAFFRAVIPHLISCLETHTPQSSDLQGEYVP